VAERISGKDTKDQIMKRQAVHDIFTSEDGRYCETKCPQLFFDEENSEFRCHSYKGDFDKNFTRFQECLDREISIVDHEACPECDRHVPKGLRTKNGCHACDATYWRK
jgi:NAD-dependent dihydropyrimidine dehydrogenase PreA subunit